MTDKRCQYGLANLIQNQNLLHHVMWLDQHNNYDVIDIIIIIIMLI